MDVMQDDRIDFLKDREKNIEKMARDNLALKSQQWFIEASNYKYSYNFDWLGLPIIQFPQDIVAIQEIIWNTKPDIIIETGIARGGSLILSASILHMLNGNGKVVGIDVDIRPHNRMAVENHPLAFRINMLEGSSIDESILNQVKAQINANDKVMVILDSNHTHEHVFKELELYAPLVTKGNYLVVMDTVVEDMPNNYYPNRPWGHGNNPKTAVHAFLENNDEFEIDTQIQNKLSITTAPDGYLIRK